MMKMSGPEKLTEQTRSHPGVLCAKCEHVNAHGRNVCESCGAHLHVVCHSCGHRNERARTLCSECGHKLHRSWGRRANRLVFGKDKRVIQVILLILAILIGAALIVFFAGLSFPQR
jgi:hypothetical protein